jgi:predicted nucleic acid-binding protein
MYLVDTNIFLEVMLARQRKDECKAFLKSLKEGSKNAFVTDFSIYSIMIIMAGLSKISELKILLSSLSAYKGAKIYHSRLTDMIRAVEVSTSMGLNIDDSIQYSSALSLGVKAIVSFDRHFDGLDIPRVEPKTIA